MENLNEFLNCYNEKDHSIALNNRNIYVSYSGDYKGNPINHVHNSCELLFIEQGGGEYKIRDQQYHIEKNGVLIIGGTDPHSRRFTQVPCIRYGLTVLPAFLQSLPVINSYMNVYRTHSPEEANKLRGIAAVAIFVLINGWNEYMYSSVLISKDALKTLTVGIVSLNTQNQVHWNDMMAASSMSCLPLIILFLCFQKYFIAGMTSGAVKS